MGNAALLFLPQLGKAGLVFRRGCGNCRGKNGEDVIRKPDSRQCIGVRGKNGEDGMDRRRKLLRNLVIVGTVVLLVVSAGAVHNWWRRRGNPDEPPLLRPMPVTLAPGLHLLGKMAPSAVYVI